MSKSKRKEPMANADEPRTAEAITVAWMLTVAATLMAEVVAIGSWLAIQSIGIEAAPRGLIVLPVVMWTSAIVTGLLDLVLGAITHRIRKVPAPTPIIIFAATIGVIPLLGLLAMMA